MTAGRVDLQSSRAVLFDLDGTLIDAVQSHLRVYRAVFSDLRLPFDEAAYAESYSPNWYLLYERMGVPQEARPQADRLWLQHYARERPHERAGAEALLRQLRKGGKARGLVTSGDRRRVERDLSQLGWGSLFEVVVCGGEVPERKPHPAALLRALSALDAMPEAAVYVGDTSEDVQMGRSAGVMTIGVTGGFSSRAALQRAAPDLLVESLREVADLL